MDKRRHPETPDAGDRPSTWSDEALIAMVVAAGEIDELDASADHASPRLRLAGTVANLRSTARIRWSWRWFAAVAALIAIGVIVFSPRTPSAPRGYAQGGANKELPSTNPPPAGETLRELMQKELSGPPEFLASSRATRPGDATVIVTISQDADGRCRCVTSVAHQLAAGQTLGDLATSELLGVGLQRLCESMPERVLVLGMSGPRELLPNNKAEAERLASCLDHGPGPCDVDASCFASSALACVAPSVNIVAETVAMRR